MAGTHCDTHTEDDYQYPEQSDTHGETPLMWYHAIISTERAALDPSFSESNVGPTHMVEEYTTPQRADDSFRLWCALESAGKSRQQGERTLERLTLRRQ